MVRVTRNYLFRGLLLAGIYSLVILGIVACGGGGGGGDGDDSAGFPTPTLPANAVTIDATNAREIAETTVEFAGVFSSFAVYKAETAPTIPNIIRLITRQVTKRDRSSPSIATRVTEDLSDEICISGTAIANYDESSDRVTGEINFNNCNIGFGIEINGNVPFDNSWDDVTLDYNIHIGGTLNFDFDSETVTIVFNFIDSGNDGTGDFTSDISFSLDGLPDGDFLVTTDKNDLWTGNYYSFDFSSGTLIVEGANFTFLNIILVPPNMADVWLDEGVGGSYFTTIPITL